MKEIIKGDALVGKILGKKKLEPNTLYRWSDFVIDYKDMGKAYLYNTFTKKCWMLEQEGLEYDRSSRFASSEIADAPALVQLVADYFLVPEDKDETATYEGFMRIARAMALTKNGFIKYTILPTTACNARCVYCFEEGIQYVTMKEDTLQQAIAFIKRTHDPKQTVTFRWFGGEPLIGEKMIDKICAAMREEQITYDATMISNGSLITEAIVKKMKDDWHIKKIQITLDGVEEEYNRRKNYYFNYDSAYWHVLSRIKLINEAGIRLVIRVNVDLENIDGVMDMMEDVKNFIPDRQLVVFDLVPMYDLQASENAREMWEKVFDVREKMEKQGFRISPKFFLLNTKFNHCIADTPRQSVVIAPDGKLYPCEHIQAMRSLGDIWSGVTDTALVSELEQVEPAREQCKGCFALPDCGTFSRCPDIRHFDCKHYKRRFLEDALNRLIRSQTGGTAIKEDIDIEC